MKNKIETIQALRGLAAFLVVVTHVAGTLSPHFSSPSWLVSSKIHWLGGIGVDIFFCISGFIMAYTFDGKTGPYSSCKFIAKRVIRIYPVYIIFTLWCLYFIKPQFLNDIGMVIDSILLTAPTMSTGHPYLIIGQGWTLQYEMYFYIVFAVTILMTKKLSVVAIVIASFYAVTSLNPGLLGPYGFMTSNAVVFDFVMGMGVAWVYKKGWFEIVPSISPLSAIVTMGLLLSLSCYLAVFNQVDKLYSFGMVACLILIVASKSTFSGSALGRVSVFVGEASYTTYLVHLLPLGYIITIIRGYDLHGANADLVIAISTIAITAMSCILYVLIEKNIVALTADLFRNTETIIDDAKKA